jgi:hypothetical protein
MFDVRREFLFKKGETMTNLTTIKTWDSTGSFKSERGFDIELWVLKPIKLFNHKQSFNFTESDIRECGSKEAVTKEYFRWLGEEGRNLTNQKLAGKLLKKTGIKVVTPFIDVPPQYKKVFLGDE